MSECQYKQKDLIRYLQNQMTREEERELQHHLVCCRECRFELEHLRRMVYELSRERQSIRKWLMVAAVACCTVGGGAYFINKNLLTTGGEEGTLEINTPKNYHSIDSIPVDTGRIDSAFTPKRKIK